MEVTFKSKEVAEAIATQVEQATGKDCQVFTDDIGDAVILHHTTVIARITELFSVIDVVPVGGTFSCEVTEIQREIRTVNGLREVARALDEATAHVASASLKR